MPRRGEFRATTDQMLELIDALRGAEERKRSAVVGSSEFLTAATEAVELSRLAFRWAEYELQMAHTAEARIKAGELGPNVRLVDVEPRPLDRVLAHWREAQLRLEIAVPGSPEAEEAARDIERLREEYQAGHETRVEADTGTRAER